MPIIWGEEARKAVHCILLEFACAFHFMNYRMDKSTEFVQETKEGQCGPCLVVASSMTLCNMQAIEKCMQSLVDSLFVWRSSQCSPQCPAVFNPHEIIQSQLNKQHGFGSGSYASQYFLISIPDWRPPLYLSHAKPKLRRKQRKNQKVNESLPS